MTDYEQVYKDFWQPLLEKDGVLDLDQMKRELFDFWTAMQEVPKVYCHITGNRLSKITYKSEEVIAVADDYYCSQTATNKNWNSPEEDEAWRGL